MFCSRIFSNREGNSVIAFCVDHSQFLQKPKCSVDLFQYISCIHPIPPRHTHHDHFITHKSFPFDFISCLSQFENLLTSMNGTHWAKNLRGISAAIAHGFSQIRWCVLAVTWTLCANSVIERKGDRQRKGKRGRPPQARLLLASPGIFSLKLFADSLWSRVPAMFWPPLAVETATEVEGKEGKKIKNNTVWHEHRLATAHWWKHYTIFN